MPAFSTWNDCFSIYQSGSRTSGCSTIALKVAGQNVDFASLIFTVWIVSFFVKNTPGSPLCTNFLTCHLLKI